jgi:hypothetical protein
MRRNRAIWIVGWGCVAALIVGIALVQWATRFADGPPYNVCGVSLQGGAVLLPAIVIDVTAFFAALVTAAGPWRIEFWRRVPAILAAVCALPVAFLSLVGMMFTYGWEC